MSTGRCWGRALSRSSFRRWGPPTTRRPSARGPRIISVRSARESPRKAHVYDVREKKYLGETGSIETMLHPARAKVFARLPYRVTGLDLKLEKARQRQGQPVDFTVAVEVSGGEPLKHVVRAELYGPGGKEIPHYAQNVLVRNGMQSGVIPLALNEATGTYRVVVTDVVTGATAEAEFTVTSG